MMCLSTIEHPYGDIKAIYSILRMIGIIPLNKNMKLSLSNLLYSFLVHLVTILTAYWGFKDKDDEELNLSFQHNWTIIFVGTTAISTLTYFIAMTKSSNLLNDMYEKIKVIDSIIGTPERNISKKYYFVIITTLFYLILVIIIEFILFSKLGNSSVEIFLWSYLYYHVAAKILALQPLIHRMEKLINLTKRQPIKENTLSILSDCYIILVDCSKTINNYQGLPILIFMMTFFVHMVATWYSYYKYAYGCVITNVCHPATFLLYLHFLLYMLCLWFTVDQTSALTNKAQEFNNKIYKRIINDETNTLCRNKKLKLHISMKKDIVFTAWGFFNLDYSLIHSMFAAGFTFIVILIQLVPSEIQKNISNSATEN